MKSPDPQKILASRNILASEKQTYLSLCDTLSHYFRPEMEVLNNSSEGSEILQPNISSGIVSLERLVGGLYSNSMALGKGAIMSSDKKLMEIPIVREWYAEVSNVTQHHINQSGFAKQFNAWLWEYCHFGGGIMYPQWNRATKTHTFLVFSEKDCFYEYDIDGEVDTMYRNYEYTADQAVAAFGESPLPGALIESYRKRDTTKKFKFIHCMRPRRNYDPKRMDARNMPFESVHILENAEGTAPTIVKESGSRQFRYIVEHFYQKTGERHGRSPAMAGLPIMRTLTQMVSHHIDGTEMAIAPPIILSDRNAVESVKLEAFGVTYADLSKGAPWTYPTKDGALQISQEFIKWMVEELRQIFYVDLFAVLEQQKSGAKTAYEISKLVAERTQAIAPVANGLSGYFRKLYKVTANDLIDAKQIMDAPSDAGDAPLDVIYTSRLDVQLKEVENVSLQEAIQQANEFAAASAQSPYVQAVVKPLEAIITIFESHNVDPSVMRNLSDAEDELAGILEQQAKMREEEMSANAVKPLDLQREPDPGSMASNMVEAGAGGTIGQ